MKKVCPLDFVILAIIITSAIFCIKKSVTLNGSRVLVQTETDTYEYALDKDGIYKVEGPLGYTTFEIKNKQIRIVDSPCPNKTCVALGWTSPIVCLPNHVIVTIQDFENSGEFDAVTK